MHFRLALNNRCIIKLPDYVGKIKVHMSFFETDDLLNNYKVMMKSINSIWVRSVIVTLIAGACAYVLYSLGIVSIIVSLLPDTTNIPADNANEVYDYYCRRTYEENSYRDPDVIIVDVADISREKIAEAIDIINKADAKVIGIDVCFLKEQPSDSVLIESIKKAGNVVLALGLDTKNDSLWRSYFANVNGFKEGLTNLYQDGRKLFTNHTHKGEEFDSFPWAIAHSFNPSITNSEVKGQYINYLDYLYDSTTAPYYASLLLDTENTEYLADFTNEVKGKIVLLGVVSTMEDSHSLPFGEYVPGVIYNAYAISSIIHQSYIKNVPPLLLWGISIIVCLFITALFFALRNRMATSFKPWIYKLIEVLLMVLIQFMCIRLFETHIFIDFIPYFTIFAFQIFWSSIMFNV